MDLISTDRWGFRFVLIGSVTVEGSGLNWYLGIRVRESGLSQSWDEVRGRV